MNTELAKKRLLDTPAAAAYLGDLRPNTLEGWRVRGVGPKYYTIGRLIRYSPAEHLDPWLEAQTRQSTSQVSV